MDQDQKDKLVAYQYALSFDLGNGRGIQVNGTFLIDDDKASMNGKLDQMWEVLERLRAKVQVEQVIGELRTALSRKMQLEEMLIRIEGAAAKRKELNKRPTDAENADIANHRTNVLAQEAAINDLNVALAELRHKAA